MKILIQEAITEASEENALLTVRMENLETKFAEIEVNMERKKEEGKAENTSGTFCK